MSPPAKKKLAFHSPSSARQSQQSPQPSPSHIRTPQQSPTTTKKVDIVGYLMMVGVKQQGTKHEYFDMRLQIASGRDITIRVMTMNLKTHFQPHHRTNFFLLTSTMRSLVVSASSVHTNFHIQ